VIVKSALSIEAGGFGLGLGLLNGIAGRSFEDAEALLSFWSVCLGPGSLILDLENISTCRDKVHWIYWGSVLTHFIVYMRTRGPSGTSHITDMFAARDPLAIADQDTRHMGVTCLDAESMLDDYNLAITALSFGSRDDAVCSCKNICP
jgi:hypothetical protein